MKTRGVGEGKDVQTEQGSEIQIIEDVEEENIEIRIEDAFDLAARAGLWKTPAPPTPHGTPLHLEIQLSHSNVSALSGLLSVREAMLTGRRQKEREEKDKSRNCGRGAGGRPATEGTPSHADGREVIGSASQTATSYSSTYFGKLFSCECDNGTAVHNSSTPTADGEREGQTASEGTLEKKTVAGAPASEHAPAAAASSPPEQKQQLHEDTRVEAAHCALPERAFTEDQEVDLAASLKIRNHAGAPVARPPPGLDAKGGGGRSFVHRRLQKRKKKKQEQK